MYFLLCTLQTFDIGHHLLVCDSCSYKLHFRYRSYLLLLFLLTEILEPGDIHTAAA